MSGPHHLLLVAVPLFDLGRRHVFDARALDLHGGREATVFDAPGFAGDHDHLELLVIRGLCIHFVQQAREFGFDFDAQRRIVLRLGVDDGRVLGKLVVAMTAPAPEQGVGAVGRDPVEPRLELCVTPEAADAAMRPEIGLLDDISRILGITGQPIGQRVGIGVGASNDLFERAVVAVSSLSDEFDDVVRQRSEVRRRGRASSVT